MALSYSGGGKPLPHPEHFALAPATRCNGGEASDDLAGRPMHDCPHLWRLFVMALSCSVPDDRLSAAGLHWRARSNAICQLLFLQFHVNAAARVADPRQQLRSSSWSTRAEAQRAPPRRTGASTSGTRRRAVGPMGSSHSKRGLGQLDDAPPGRKVAVARPVRRTVRCDCPSSLPLGPRVRGTVDLTCPIEIVLGRFSTEALV